MPESELAASLKNLKEESIMLKLRNLMLALVTLAVFMAVPAFADPGCKNGKFVGSYVRAAPVADLWGDGSNVAHTFTYQLNLNSDGTAVEQFTGTPDVMLSSGTGTPAVGSWQCQKDGKLVVTILSALYTTTNEAAMHGILNVPVDLFLFAHVRSTYLFNVADDTLTRIQARNRVYLPPDDPTNPAGGNLRPLNTTTVVYRRTVASDADLLAP